MSSQFSTAYLDRACHSSMLENGAVATREPLSWISILDIISLLQKKCPVMTIKKDEEKGEHASCHLITLFG